MWVPKMELEPSRWSMIPNHSVSLKLRIKPSAHGIGTSSEVVVVMEMRQVLWSECEVFPHELVGLHLVGLSGMAEEPL